MKKSIVLYHDHCTDGYGAAYAAWHSLGDDAEYIGVQYGKDFDATVCIDRDVYVLDFSFQRPVMETLINVSSRFVWLDHHKTAFEMWCPTERERFESVETMNASCIVLDNNKSGAMLAWEYFHASESPYIIDLIDDRDRWQFKLPDSKAFHAGMAASKPWTFEQWHDIHVNDDSYDRVIGIGNVLLARIEQEVQGAAKKSRKCRIFMGYNHVEGLAVNATANLSEVGHELAVQSGTYGMVYYIDADNKVKVSLRSNGDYDVSEIAKSLGGGGHKNAAGCEITLYQLQEFLK